MRQLACDAIGVRVPEATTEMRRATKSMFRVLKRSGVPHEQRKRIFRRIAREYQTPELFVLDCRETEKRARAWALEQSPLGHMMEQAWKD